MRRYHLVRRADAKIGRTIAFYAVGLLVSLLIGAVILFALGINPLDYYGKMFTIGLVGNRYGYKSIEGFLKIFVPLLITSLALGLSFKMRFWNIGGEGQVLIGCMASGAVMHNHPEIPNALLLILMLVAAMAAGAIWGMIPAFFKAKWNTNETLFTLMMNYVAIQITAYFTIRWEVPKGSGKIGVINQNTMAGWLPKIADQQYLLTIIVVAALTIFMYFYLKYSKQGYEIAVVGESERTARYVGIKVEHVFVRTMAISGALCGLIGYLLVAGSAHTITTTLSGGRGFTGVMVAWMAKFNPILMILTSFLIAFMGNGAQEIASRFYLNHSFSDILTGIIIFFLIGCEFFVSYKLEHNKHREEA